MIDDPETMRRKAMKRALMHQIWTNAVTARHGLLRCLRCSWTHTLQHSPDAVLYVSSSQNSGFSFCTYCMPMARPLQTEYVRLHRATIADPGDESPRMQAEQELRDRQQQKRKLGRPGGQAVLASQKYQLCQKYTLDLWRRVPYNPFSLFRRMVMPI